MSRVLDSDGNASPAILIDNATAANRAVNLPEFVNIPPDGLMNIDVPAAESYRLFDLASDLSYKGRLEEAIDTWKRVIGLDPENAQAEMNLGIAQQIAGDLREDAMHLQRAKEIDPGLNEDDSSYGIAFLNREQFDISLKSSDCEGILVYGKKVLSVDPSDIETSKAVAVCAMRKSSKQEH